VTKISEVCKKNKPIIPGVVVVVVVIEVVVVAGDDVTGVSVAVVVTGDRIIISNITLCIKKHFTSFLTTTCTTRKPCCRREDRAMRSKF